MGQIEFVLRFKAIVNDVTLHCEKLFTLPFVPQIGMGFCVSRRYHELTVKGVWWTDNGDEKELAVVCNTITHRTTLEDSENVEAELRSEGWDVHKST